jgi:hypothetical protein
VNERCEQEKRHTHEKGDVSEVVREHLHIDEVDHSPVEPAFPTEQPVDEVPKRSAENEAESNSFDAAGCVAEDNHDHDDHTDSNNGQERTLIGEDRETGAGVVGEPELENALDDNDRCVRKRVDSPRLG